MYIIIYLYNIMYGQAIAYVLTIICIYYTNQVDYFPVR